MRVAVRATLHALLLALRKVDLHTSSLPREIDGERNGVSRRPLVAAMTQIFWSCFWFAAAYAASMAGLSAELPRQATQIYFDWSAIVAGCTAVASFNHATLQGMSTAQSLLYKGLK